MTLFDSMITFSAPAILRSMSGMASPKRPWRVRTHRERRAPATRKREVSLSPLRSRSSLRARKWSSPVSQSHGLPSAEQMPCPNCVILRAVQLSSGSAAIRPATTLVLPTLRECPPITTIAISLFSQVSCALRTPNCERSQGPCWPECPTMRFVNTWSGRWPVRYLIATLAVALPIAALEKLRPELSQTSIALILVLPVILVAVTQGRGPALYASIIVGLSFNFFFIGPYYSFRINRPEDVVAFVVFVTTAVLVGQLSSRLEKRVLLTETQRKELVHVRGKFERAAAQAAEADALRKSEQLKTALLDAVTHDLRTPLTSIKAAISTIRSEPVTPEVQRELFEVIEQESDRLNHFIQGMMDLAKLQAGEITLASRNVAADEMVEDALLRAEPLLEGHPVEVAIASGLPAPKVDPRLIAQVIFTLLENAAKYSGTSAKITISVRRQGNKICFAVDDEGPGIPPELRGQVFEKFFRAGLQPGLGTGLAIARGIVQAHGGKIWIESGPDGKGTSVQFQLPLPEPPCKRALWRGARGKGVALHDR